MDVTTHKSEMGIEPLNSEVTGASSEDGATMTLVCKIIQSYMRNLNSLALTCVSLTLLLYKSITKKIFFAGMQDSVIHVHGMLLTLMKTYKDTLPFLDLCLAIFRMNESRYPANNLKYCNISRMHE